MAFPTQRCSPQNISILGPFLISLLQLFLCSNGSKAVFAKEVAFKRNEEKKYIFPMCTLKGSGTFRHGGGKDMQMHGGRYSEGERD